VFEEEEEEKEQLEDETLEDLESLEGEPEQPEQPKESRVSKLSEGAISSEDLIRYLEDKREQVEGRPDIDSRWLAGFDYVFEIVKQYEEEEAGVEFRDYGVFDESKKHLSEGSISSEDLIRHLEDRREQVESRPDVDSRWLAGFDYAFEIVKQYEEEEEAGAEFRDYGVFDESKKHLIEMKIIDHENNKFDVYLVDDGTKDTVIDIAGREFRFDADFAALWRDSEGNLSEEGLRELALDALSSLGEDDYNELLARSADVDHQDKAVGEAKVDEATMGVDYIKKAKSGMKDAQAAMRNKDYDRASEILDGVADDCSDGAKAAKKMKIVADDKAEKAAAKEKEKEVDEGLNNPGVRDGSGPARGSAQRRVSGDRGKRRIKGESCPKKMIDKEKMKRRQEEARINCNIREGADRDCWDAIVDALPNKDPRWESVIDLMAQVWNGGFRQWIDNGFAEKDGEMAVQMLQRLGAPGQRMAELTKEAMLRYQQHDTEVDPKLDLFDSEFYRGLDTQLVAELASEFGISCGESKANEGGQSKEDEPETVDEWEIKIVRLYKKALGAGDTRDQAIQRTVQSINGVYDAAQIQTILKDRGIIEKNKVVRESQLALSLRSRGIDELTHTILDMLK